MGMEKPEIYSASRCNNPTYLCGPLKYPVLREAVYRAQNGKLHKFGRTYFHRTVFAPRKYLYQKEANDMEKPEMYSTVGAITPLTCAGHQNTPSRGRQYRAQNGKLGKLGRTYGHGTVFAPSKYLYEEEAMGMEKPEIHSASRCNNPTYLCGPLKYVLREAVYRAQNGKLCKLGRTYDQKYIPLVGAITPLTCAGR